LQQLINRIQAKRRPSFGASIADASKIMAKQGLGIIIGAYVGKVRAGSVADRIGVIPGDVITELNMKSIANAKDLEDALSALNIGSRISLSIVRGDRTVSAEGSF
jgi:S1-C subfamily serine protease